MILLTLSSNKHIILASVEPHHDHGCSQLPVTPENEQVAPVPDCVECLCAHFEWRAKMTDVYVKNPRFTQTFDPLQFKEIALNDGDNVPLVLKVYEPFHLDLHPTVDNSHQYDVDFAVRNVDVPEDRTSEVVPLPVMDNTTGVANYMLDRVDYDVLLNKTNIDRLDNVKASPT